MQKKFISITPQKIFLFFLIIFFSLIFFTNYSFGISGSGSGTWSSEHYNSDIKTTDNLNSKYGIFTRSLVNLDTNEKITVFCSEHGVSFYTGEIYEAEYYKPTDERMRQACKIAYFGWYSKYGSYSDYDNIFSNLNDYIFTQQYIWETLGQTDATFIDDSLQNQYIVFKNDIDNKINRIQIKPSFNETTIDVKLGESIIINDANEILNTYSSIDKNFEGIRIIHNNGENFLNLIIEDDCNLEQLTISDEMFKNLGLIKEETIDYDTTLYFLFPDNIQNQLYSVNYNEPVSLSFNLKISQMGKLELIKTDNLGALLEGSEFNITGPDNFNENVTIKNGKIIIENLKKGKYYIQEILAPEGYALDKTVYEIEIEPNKTTTQSIINIEKPKEDIIINKTIANIEDADTLLIDSSDLSEIQFELLARDDILDCNDNSIIYSKNEKIDTYNLEQNGELIIENLPLGLYGLQEVKTLDGLVLDENIYEIDLRESDLNENNSKTIDIENKPTYVEFIKTDFSTGEEIEGAILQVVDDEEKVIDEWISQKLPHKIAGLTIGKKYSLLEKIAPSGYEKAERIDFIVSKDNKKIEMKDKKIIIEEPKMGDSSIKDILISLVILALFSLLILKIFDYVKENKIINGEKDD